MVLTEPCSILHGSIAVCYLGSNSRIPLAFKPAKSKIHLAARPPRHILRVCRPTSGLHPQSRPHPSPAPGSQPGPSSSDLPGAFPKYRYYSCVHFFFLKYSTDLWQNPKGTACIDRRATPLFTDESRSSGLRQKWKNPCKTLILTS